MQDLSTLRTGWQEIERAIEEKEIRPLQEMNLEERLRVYAILRDAFVTHFREVEHEYLAEHEADLIKQQQRLAKFDEWLKDHPQ